MSGTDIVEELRERYALEERDAASLAAEEHDYCASGCPDREAAQRIQEAEIYKDAADEIERLRKIEEYARVYIVCTEERIDASAAIKTGDLSLAHRQLREALYG